MKRNKATGSLVIPEEQWEKATTGVVISVGGDVQVDVEKGDSVRFSEYGTDVIEDDLIVVTEHLLRYKL